MSETSQSPMVRERFALAFRAMEWANVHRPRSGPLLFDAGNGEVLMLVWRGMVWDWRWLTLRPMPGG
jgi:hypothetical protein